MIVDRPRRCWNYPRRSTFIQLSQTLDGHGQLNGASTQLVDCPNRSKYLSQKIQISVPKAWWDEDRQLIDRALMQISRLYSNKSNNIFLVMIQSWTVLDKSNKLYLFWRVEKLWSNSVVKTAKSDSFPDWISYLFNSNQN